MLSEPSVRIVSVSPLVLQCSLCPEQFTPTADAEALLVAILLHFRTHAAETREDKPDAA